MRPGFSLSYPNSPPPTVAVDALPPAADSAWHSPVPYLFGGLAAMLGLITLALLILACSYWKLSGYLDGGDHSAEHDRPTGVVGKSVEVTPEKPAAEFEERVVVIMAGVEESIFLAIPISKNVKLEAGVSVPSGDRTHSEKS